MERINWSDVTGRMPCSKTDRKQKFDRKKLWKAIDTTNTGYLTLEELDEGIRRVLKLDAVFDAKPAIQRAFMAAKSAN